MSIILDFDDVCVEFTATFFKWHNTIYGTNLHIDDIITFDLTIMLDVNRDEAVSRLKAFNDSDEFIHMQPVKGSQEGLAELAKLDRLVVISFRDRTTEQATRAQAERFFPGLIKEIVCVGNWVHGKGGDKKEEVAKLFDAKLAIDDGVHHIEAYGKNEIPAILFTQPWNKHHPHHHHIRVHNWKECVARAKEIYNR